MEEITKKAYAKINLGLDVVRRLENGYHEVRMVMQTMGIYDELTFTKLPEGIELSSNHGSLAMDESNLIYKAIRLMQDKYSIKGGVKAHLVKNIPIAAGLAGGSTDAAATLKAMNELFELGASEKELMEIGVKIGADVPYCVMGGTALAEGIGEKLTALSPMPKCYLLVAKPPIDVSTKYVYEHLDAEGVKVHPDIDGMVAAVQKQNLAGVTERMANVLEEVTIKKHPVISQIKEAMLEMGAENSLMSGSGPTVFGVFSEEQAAKTAYESLKLRFADATIFVTSLQNN